VILAVSAIGGQWAYGKWINRQSWKLAGLAEQQAREGRTTEALMSLETSLRLRPNNPSALRQLARIHTSLGQRKEALAAWQKLSEANALTAADAQEYGLLAGVEGEWALANLIIDGFSAGNQGPEPDLLRANILALRGDKAGAEESLRKAVEKDETERSRAILARFLINQRLNRSTAPEILELHRGLIELPNDTGAQALADALLAGIVPPKERTNWIESLRNHPKATPGLLLAADSAEAASDPAAIPLLAAKVSSRLEKSPADQRRAGFLWLARHGQPARALRLLTLDEALADPDSFTAWIEALAATGQAEKIPEALDLPANPLPAYRSALYRARALALSLCICTAGRAASAAAVLGALRRAYSRFAPRSSWRLRPHSHPLGQGA
jgi:tetratricopeptide (TPR) repeat protein